MKKYYYFSNSKLKFVEIKNARLKFLMYSGVAGFLFALLFWGGYLLYQNTYNPQEQISYLKLQNSKLLKKLEDYNSKFDSIQSEVNYLAKTNNDLRIKLNLTPLDSDFNDFGIGGERLDVVDYSLSNNARQVLDTLNTKLNVIAAKLKVEKNNFSEVEQTLNRDKKLYECLPAIRPTNGPIGDRFGMRFHPILKVRRMHNGVDFLVNTGTPVYATGDGVVKFVGRKRGLGRTVIIDHGFGYTTIYGHLHRFKVKKGQRVKRGDLIALSGNSGRLTTGPHLHYEVRHNGIALNPQNFMLDDMKLFDYLATIHKEKGKVE